MAENLSLTERKTSELGEEKHQNLKNLTSRNKSLNKPEFQFQGIPVSLSLETMSTLSYTMPTVEDLSIICMEHKTTLVCKCKGNDETIQF